MRVTSSYYILCFANGRSYSNLTCSFYFLQMLGLDVNTFIEIDDLEKYEGHRMKASTMDLNDIMERRVDYPPLIEEPMPDLEMDDDEPEPSQREPASPTMRGLAIEDTPALNVTPIMALHPNRLGAEFLSTPVGYTGSSAGTTQDV